ncbi:MAG: carbohydrate ABC transporter permease [Lachnospiraceae bacterium]|nr:carbohydrate ABC transporter permease [Lachnospiraceae bacterium]
MKKKTPMARLGRAVIFIVLVALALTFLYPLFFMFSNSLKTLGGYYRDPFGLPKEALEWNNFFIMIRQFKIFKLFGNTLIVSLATVIGLIVFGVPASYAFSKVRFPGGDALYFAILATLFIPVQVTIIPMYVTFAKLKLVDNFFSVILANWAAFLPETIMLMTAMFKSIPNALLEAAEIDGCNYLQRLLHIIVPMGRPAISLTVIIFFINSWNDLFTPMILLKSTEKRTVIVALSSLVGRYSGDPPFQYAGLLLSAIPALIIYIIFQKRIIDGMSMGAVK